MRTVNFENSKGNLLINSSIEAESLEIKLEKIVNSKEPIGDVVAPIYTERKNGVEAQYDIRTDRFDIAMEACEKIDMSNKARREQRIKDREPKVVKDESTEATNSNNN